MTIENIPGSLRVGQIKGTDRTRSVVLAYGRSRAGERDETWGGQEIVTPIIASHFAQRYVQLLGGKKELPSVILNDMTSFFQWEVRLGEFTYFLSIAWERENERLHTQLTPRAELYFRGRPEKWSKLRG